ncbi:MAG: hypothetical protein IT462_00875 [Planctomycetes bacterium]|nr:hypothetical protein [Planctomycetota bacterium]
MFLRTFRRFALLLMAVPVLALAACHDHDDDHRHEEPDFEIPGGGADFGTFAPFEHDFDQRDIDSASDQDGFTFSLSESSSVLITITGSGGFDGFIDLYDADLDFIAGDSDGGPGPDAVLVLELFAGDYVLIVGGEGASTGDYDLDILVGTLGGLDFEVLDPGTSYIDDDGSLDDVDDTDCFFFTVLDDETLDIRLTRLSGTYDGNLQLLDQYGEEWDYADPAGTANPAILDITLPPGSYMIVVGCNAGDGDYRLRIDVE